MAEVVSIKTQKPPVESVTIKFTKAEAQDVVRALSSYWGPYSPLLKTLKRAIDGDTKVLTNDLISSMLTAPRPF